MIPGIWIGEARGCYHRLYSFDLRRLRIRETVLSPGHPHSFSVGEFRAPEAQSAGRGSSIPARDSASAALANGGCSNGTRKGIEVEWPRRSHHDPVCGSWARCANSKDRLGGSIGIVAMRDWIDVGVLEPWSGWGERIAIPGATSLTQALYGGVRDAHSRGDRTSF